MELDITDTNDRLRFTKERRCQGIGEVRHDGPTIGHAMDMNMRRL